MIDRRLASLRLAAILLAAPCVFAQVPLDPNLFSNSNQPGVVALDLPGVTRESGREIIAQPDGFIVVAGDAHSDPDALEPSRIVLARVKPRSTPIALPGGGAATLDSGFAGGAGFIVDDLGRSTHGLSLEGLVQQPGGRIVLLVHSARLAEGSNAAEELLLAGYAADGTSDAAFGSNGIVSLPICTGDGCALRRPLSFDLAMTPDGALVTAASIMKLNPGGALQEIEMEFRRLDPDGDIDTGFGIAGLKRHDEFAGLDIDIGGGYVRIAALADGRIAVVNNTLDLSLDGFGTPAIMLLRDDGNADTAFGSGGSRLLPIDPIAPAMIPYALSLAADGRIVVAGMALAAGSDDPDFFAARVTANGNVDATFGDDGIAFGDFSVPGDSRDLARALVLDDDGRPILVGESGPNEDSTHIGIQRLLPDGTPDIGFAPPRGLRRYTELAVQTGLTNFFLSHERAFGADIGPDGALVATGARVGTDGSDRSEDRLLVFRLRKETLLDDGFEQR